MLMFIFNNSCSDRNLVLGGLRLLPHSMGCKDVVSHLGIHGHHWDLINRLVSEATLGDEAAEVSLNGFLTNNVLVVQSINPSILGIPLPSVPWRIIQVAILCYSTQNSLTNVVIARIFKTKYIGNIIYTESSVNRHHLISAHITIHLITLKEPRSQSMSQFIC